MKVLTRYLIRAHIGPLLFAFIALTGVILVNTLAKELANLAGKGLPLRVVVEFFVLSLPANIALTLPMSVLVSVLYTFSNLSLENEITALRASGIDLRRATLPIILLAALIAGGMVWFNDQVLPASNYRWRLLMTDVAQTRPLLALREQTINPIRTSDGMTPYYLEAEQLNAETGEMKGISIYDVSSDEVSRTIKADSGRMAFNPSYTDLLLRLYNGNVREVDFDDPAAFQLVDFDQQVMRMQGVSQRLDRSTESAYRTDRDMTMGMMRARIFNLSKELEIVRTTMPEPVLYYGNQNDSAAATSGDSSSAATDTTIPAGEAGSESAGPDFSAGPPAAMDGAAPALLDTLVPADAAAASPPAESPAAAGPAEPAPGPGPGAEARQYAEARTRTLEYQIREFEVEIQKKLSIAAATLVFVLIGIPIALRFPSGGIGMVVAVSLLIFGVYYVGLIGGETLGDEGYVPPVVAMWTTNLLFGIAGMIGFWRLGREQGTSRSSSLPDLRQLFRRRSAAAE